VNAVVRPRLVARDLTEALDRIGWGRVSLRGASTVRVSGITHDSRAVLAGDIYAALPGANVHGGQFVFDAVTSGAAAVLTDSAGAELAGDIAVPIVIVDDARSIAGELAAWVYGDPAESMLMIGLTGTNGKTTTAHMVDAGLRAGGYSTGIIGTIGTRIGDTVLDTARTTPEATDVHALLAVMRERGVTAVTMEVSSHALVLHRVAGLVFDLAGFTNLSLDHLDFHGSMQAYFEAKATLFTPARARRAIVCIDQPWGTRIFDAAQIPSATLATEGGLADWQVQSVTSTPQRHTLIDLRQPDGSTVQINSKLPGRFNVANMSLAYALLATAGIAHSDALAGLAGMRGVPGRMERVGPVAAEGFDVYVDYAHTPDAIDRVVATAREFTAGRVLVVVGAGGDRDREKRPLMGQAASAADVVVVTDDNPRSEDAEVIRAAIVSGISADTQLYEEADRRRAIALAIASADAGDCVLILGKGHETGQEIAGVKHPFDDRDEAMQALTGRGPRQ